MSALPLPSDDVTLRFWEVDRYDLFNRPASTMATALLRAEVLRHRLMGCMVATAPLPVRQDIQRLRAQWKYLADSGQPVRSQMNTMMTDIMRRTSFVSTLSPTEREAPPEPEFLRLPVLQYRQLGRGIGRTAEEAQAADTLGRYLGGVGLILNNFRHVAMGRTPPPAPPSAPAPKSGGPMIAHPRGRLTLYVHH